MWKKQMEEKKKMQEIRKIEKEMKKERMQRYAKKRQKVDAKKKRKDENELRTIGMNGQVITNTLKIRKWAKKARSQLLKVSPEFLQHCANVKIKGLQ